MLCQVRLLVIDSLGGLYRGLAEAPHGEAAAAAAALAEQTKQRARSVQRLAARLKQISAVYNVRTILLSIQSLLGGA